MRGLTKLTVSAIAAASFGVLGSVGTAHADTASCIPTVDYPQSDGTVWASIYCPSGGIGRIDLNVYEDGHLVYQPPDTQCMGSTSVVFVNCSRTYHFGTRTSGHTWCNMTWFLLSGGTDSEKECIAPNGSVTYTSSGWH